MMKRMKDDAVKRTTATEYLHRKAQKMNPNYNKNQNYNNDNGYVGSNSLFAINNNNNNNNDQTKENHDHDDHNQDSDINNNNDDDDDNNDIDVLTGSVHIPCHINSSVDDSSEDHDKHTDLLPKTSAAATNSYSHSYPLKSSLDKHNKTNNNKFNNNNNRSISSTTTIPMSLDKNDIINMIQSFDLSRNMEIIKINNDIMKLKASLNHNGAVASAVENNRIMKTSTVIKPTHHYNDSL